MKTPLHYATEYQDAIAVQALIDSGADVSTVNEVSKRV